VTHDVKNPLGAANGYAQLLEEGIVGPLDDAQVKMVGRIRHLLGVSIQTVTDLLELARADGTLHLEYAMTDVAATTNEVIDDHRGMAQERQVTIEVNAEPVTVMTDPLRLRQILSNLITNAIKYTPAGGNVWTRIVHEKRRGAPERIGIAVEDDGPGIPREAEPRLFEEFFRVRTADGSAGNGLGLAISRRLGRLLGGDVTYARREGRGSVFTVWLPCEGVRREA
jgi:signal transduction histidine kinase